MRRYSFFIIVLIIFLVDRLSKQYIEGLIPVGGAIEFASFFSLVHVRNYGGAFSILSHSEYATIVFTVLPLGIVAFLLFILFKTSLTPFKKISLLLIVGGALGNLYDRITKGYVIDFLDFHYGNLHWPSFNVADASITTGVFLWIFMEIKKGR